LLFTCIYLAEGGAGACVEALPVRSIPEGNSIGIRGVLPDGLVLRLTVVVAGAVEDAV